jgi:hypothetical protein
MRQCLFFCGEFLPLCKKYFGKAISCHKFCVLENKLSAKKFKKKEFTRNHHNCLQHERLLKIFLLSYFVSPNLAKYWYDDDKLSDISQN